MKSLVSLRHITGSSRMSAYRKIKKCIMLSFTKAIAVMLLLCAIMITVVKKDNGVINRSGIKKADVICTEKVIKSFGVPCSTELIETFITAERISGINRYMLIALAITESGIRGDISSSKGYRGIMQIPLRTVSDGVNIIAGAEIFKEKMRITDGDIRKAISLYKGYGKSRKGLEKAGTVFMIYRGLIKTQKVIEECI